MTTGSRRLLTVLDVTVVVVMHDVAKQAIIAHAQNTNVRIVQGAQLSQEVVQSWVVSKTGCCPWVECSLGIEPG